MDDDRGSGNGGGTRAAAAGVTEHREGYSVMCAAAVTAEGSGGNTRAREAGGKAKPHSNKILKKREKEKNAHTIYL